MGQVGFSIGGKPEGLKKPKRAHELSFPEAIKFGELRLIEEDLKSALLSVSTLHAQYPKAGGNPVDAPFCAALYRDAIIQFVACFDHKKGLVTGEVYASVKGALQYMQRLRAVRDTFVAHTFGPMRQFSVAAVPGTLRRPHLLHHAVMVFSTPAEAGDIEELARFIEIARREVVAKVAVAKEEVATKLKTLTPAQLRALPHSAMMPPSAAELRMTRSQFRAARAGTSPSAPSMSRRSV